METYQEMMAAHHERMLTKMDSLQEKWKPCLGKAEATEEVESES
jgi:hypothetical protein